MNNGLFEMRFYETYYLANIVHNVIRDPYPFIVNLDGWCGESGIGLLLQPFRKQSCLHTLAQFILRSVIEERVSDIEVDAIVHDARHQLWVDDALRHHGFECQGFRSWLKDMNVSTEDLTEDHIFEYHEELYLSGPLDDLVEHIGEEIFYLLFGNRECLAVLNEFLSRIVAHMGEGGFDGEPLALFEAEGVLKRAHIPEWVRRAVYFRDKGLCTLCNQDITGLISPESDRHFDHIVPLRSGGLNDVTNIQLLCSACNQKKGARYIATARKYQRWY